MIVRKNYPPLPKPAGPYSYSVKHNNTLYLSGLSAFGTPAQGKNVSEQAEVIFSQIKTIIHSEGIGMENLLRITIYVTSFNDTAKLREVLAKNYEGSHPASALIGVAELFSPEISIEIETTFAINH